MFNHKKNKIFTIIVVSFLILAFIMLYIPMLFVSAPDVPNNGTSPATQLPPREVIK